MISNVFKIFLFTDTFQEATIQLEHFSNTGRFKKANIITSSLRKGSRCRKPPNRFTPNESSSDEDIAASQFHRDLDTSTENERNLTVPPKEPELLSSLRVPATSGCRQKRKEPIVENQKSLASSRPKRPAKCNSTLKFS